MLWLSIFLIALVLFYVLWGRTWLKAQPWAQGFFTWIEPYEIVLFKKSETILWQRTKMLIGVSLAALAQLGTIDFTSLMPFVPAKYEGLAKIAFNLLPLIIALDGSIGEKLRNGTTKPLAVVAIPESAPVEVKIAAAKAEVANEVAVVAAENAKAA